MTRPTSILRLILPVVLLLLVAGPGASAHANGAFDTQDPDAQELWPSEHDVHDPEMENALRLVGTQPILDGDLPMAPSCSAKDLGLRWPMDGVNGRHYMINNYLDLDPDGGDLRDYRGKTGSLARTYDGHRGVDVDLPTFRQMDNNAARIRAAAPGVVTFVREDQPDRNIVSLGSCNATWNVVVVRHANGFQTVYGHLKRNWVRVAKGDKVQRGQVLAIAGSSGCSTHPHLHFELRDCSGTRLEPFNSGVFNKAPAYEPTSNVMDVVLRAGGSPSTNQIKDPSEPAVFKPGSTLGIGLSLAARGGDQVGLKLIDPSGKTRSSWTWTIGNNARLRHFFPRWSRTLGKEVGLWRVDVRVNGALRARRSVPVSHYRPGFAEVARHGVAAKSWQTVFVDVATAGYRPVWIDGYQVAGKTRFNGIFRPADGTRWVARHGLSSAQYQAEFDKWTARGYRPLQVASYPSGSGIRYALIFVKKSGPAWRAYHGRTASQHQSLFNSLTSQGYRPINVSVVSLGGKRYYTAFYEKKSLGAWQLKSFLTASQYQSYFNSNLAAGRQLLYLDVYDHGGSPRFSAIWSSKATGSFVARHGLTSSQYQNVWQAQTSKGLLTRIVVGYPVGSSTRFAALWRK